jgi:glycoside/pentoside/hexuronide:cation symporter, GPH family
MPGDGNDGEERLPRHAKLLYGIGDTGFSLTGTIIGVLFAIYLTDVVGLRPGLAAVALFIGRTWDYINDPLIGHLSDRTRSRWGRRRPFLLFGFLPFALAFTLLWWKPPISAPLGLAVYYALAYLLYDAAATFVYMPYFALTPELTLDYDERTSLTGYRMAFSILGSLVAFTVPLLIIGTMRPENAGRVLAMGALFGAVSALPLLLVFFSTRERPEFQAQVQPALKESLRAAIHNRPFLFAVGIFLLTWTAVDIVQAMLLFFLKYRMGLEAQSDLIAGTVFVVALLALPFWAWASHHWDKRLAYVGGIAFWAAVQVVLVVISPGWGMPVVLILAALAGIGVGAAHVLPWSIIPDAVEWDELATGQRHEGMFYSLVTLMQKVASSIAIPLALLMLELTGYVPNAPVQLPAAVRGIQVLMGPVPAVLLGCGILFALLYPLDRERHAQVRAELAARRSGGFRAGD